MDIIVWENDDYIQITDFLVKMKKKILGDKTDRGINLSQGTYPKRLDFNATIPLEQGKNQIMVRAIDSDGIPSEKVLTVNSIKRRRNILAVVIGIDEYKKFRKLRYAAKDAGAFYRHLVDYTRIPPENVILLLNQDANLIIE